MLQELEVELPTFAFQRRFFLEETEGHYDGLIANADRFLNKYCEYTKLDVSQVASAYQRFQKQYSKDIRAFNDVADYKSVPREEFTLSREDYDIALILSVAVSVPRCEIMQAIADFKAGEELLIVGVGAGLELSYLQSSAKISAYDLSLSEFAPQQFPDVSFHASEYASADVKYDAVMAIELLEHIEDPYPLLDVLLNSLKSGGKGLFTTALNLPQFDHLYNFEDEQEVESFMTDRGCRLLEKKVLPHNYRYFSKDANNIVWAVEKVSY